MKRAAVYCGAAEGINPIYKEQTIALGEWLLANNYELVYGGGKVGLMGIIADTILKGRGNVTGIMPKFLKDREIAHENLTTLEVVETMPERKTRMIDLADVFIALPGGPGTLEEISEVISLGRVAQHQNPCVLYNVAGYYDGLASFFDTMVAAGFLSQTDRDNICISDSLSKIKTFIENYQAPQAREYR